MSILPSSAARAQRRGEKRPAFPKPRGAAPGDAHGALCTWDFEGGGWLDSHGNPHVVVKNPKRRREAAQRDDHLAAAVDSAEPSPSPPPLPQAPPPSPLPLAFMPEVIKTSLQDNDDIQGQDGNGTINGVAISTWQRLRCPFWDLGTALTPGQQPVRI